MNKKTASPVVLETTELKGEKLNVAVVSDTHGSRHAVEACIRLAPDVDAWIHLGDNQSDACRIESICKKPVFAVRGNCDLGGAKELVLIAGGHRLLLLHGHYYHVKSGSSIAEYRAEELECKALLYGHTHIAELANNGGMLVLNPGSAAYPRGGSKHTFAVITIDGKRLNARLIRLYP